MNRWRPSIPACCASPSRPITSASSRPNACGLCGAYNWLDGKAAYEIDETGPNQPIQKGECLDPVKGIWKGINDYVYTSSHKAARRVLRLFDHGPPHDLLRLLRGHLSATCRNATAS